MRRAACVGLFQKGQWRRLTFQLGEAEIDTKQVRTGGVAVEYWLRIWEVRISVTGAVYLEVCLWFSSVSLGKFWGISLEIGRDVFPVMNSDLSSRMIS